DRNSVARGLAVALAAARWLRDHAALAFVAAPMTTRDGASLCRLDDRYTVSVSPFLDGVSHPFGPHEDPGRRARVLYELIALHAVAPGVEIADYRLAHISSRPHLESFLRQPSARWLSGPIGEQAHAQLLPHASALAERLERFDRAAAAL